MSNEKKAPNLHNVEFLRSAVKESDFPFDSLPQIVFAGKSNVGKSSVINKLLNRKNFARVSAQPGKTIHINYFTIDKQLYFVDLPGYGYARVSKAEQQRWGALMETYFAMGLLTLGIQIVDIRHKPTRDDMTMAEWFRASGKPWVIIANKLDKIKKSQLEGNIAEIRQTLLLPEEVPVIPFSAEKGMGREEVLSIIFDHAARKEEYHEFSAPIYGRPVRQRSAEQRAAAARDRPHGDRMGDEVELDEHVHSRAVYPVLLPYVLAQHSGAICRESEIPPEVGACLAPPA